MPTFTITTTPTPSFKKWDTISNGGNQVSYVIKSSNKNGAHTMSLFPKEEQENAFAQFVWYWCLRLCIFFKII